MDSRVKMSRAESRSEELAGYRNTQAALELESLEHCSILAQSLSMWMGTIVYASENLLRTSRSLGEGRVFERFAQGSLELISVTVS